MSPLDQVFSRIIELKNNKLQPLVVFDLDDTIIDCRYRKKVIVEEFCAIKENHELWPLLCEKVLKASLEDYEYKVSDFLSNIDINNKDFLNELEKYWFDRYFTNEYSSL